MSSVSSPPTITTGRRMRTQRRSRAAVPVMTLDRLGLGFERLVVDRVVHRDQVAVDLDRVRHVHVAADGSSEALRDHRLAVARRAVEEQRLAGVDRGPELLEDVVADDEVREAAAQAFAIDVAARGHQRSHLGDVGGQRNRRRPDVLAGVQIEPAAIASLVGQRVSVPGRSGRRRSFRGPRSSCSTRACSISGSSMLNGRRMRSAVIMPVASPA